MLGDRTHNALCLLMLAVGLVFAGVIAAAGDPPRIEAARSLTRVLFAALGGAGLGWLVGYVARELNKEIANRRARNAQNQKDT